MTITEIAVLLAVQTRQGDDYGPSLLSQLREARYSSVGTSKGGGGGGSSVIGLNLEAHRVWEDLTGQIASAYSSAVDEVDERLGSVHRFPEHFVLAWATSIQSQLDSNRLTAEHAMALWANTLRTLDMWSQDIRNLLDPPPTKEIGYPCPECGESRVLVGEGELQVEATALLVTARPGEDMVAQCRNPNCRSRWVGDQEIIQLGRQVGRDIDPDLIREARSVVAS